MSGRSGIDRLLESTPALWRGRQAGRGQRALSTGHAGLDARLPGGGWPLGAVSELISARPGLGEFSLLFPALTQIGKQGGWLVLVDPPWVPYPPALCGAGLSLECLLRVCTRGGKESLWACEQALRGNRGGALLAWPERIGFARLRRLQLAAEAGSALTFLFRPETALREPSPAALRLHLEADARGGTRVSVLKCRGSRPAEPFRLARPFPLHGNALQPTEHHDHGRQAPARAPLARPAFFAPGAGHRDPRPERAENARRGQRLH